MVQCLLRHATGSGLGVGEGEGKGLQGSHAHCFGYLDGPICGTAFKTALGLIGVQKQQSLYCWCLRWRPEPAPPPTRLQQQLWRRTPSLCE